MKAKKFKRVLAVALAGAMMFGITACGDTKQNSKSEGGKTTAASEDGSYSLNVGASNTNGTYYQWLLPVTELVNSNVDNVTLNAVPTAGTAENISYLEAGEAQLGGGPSSTLWAYLNGKYGYEEAKSGLSAMVSSYGDYFYICVPKDSKINSIADMEGCKFNIMPTSSSVNSICRNFFDILGYDLNSYCSIYEMSHSEAVSAMQEGTLDAMAIQVGLGNSTIMELATSKSGVKLIPFSADEIAKITEAWPGYVEKTIPAGTYEGVDEDVATVGSFFLTYIRDDVPEDVAYEITKTIYENTDSLTSSIAVAEESIPENLMTATGDGEKIPIHPGTQKYLKEIGLLK